MFLGAGIAKQLQELKCIYKERFPTSAGITKPVVLTSLTFCWRKCASCIFTCFYGGAVCSLVAAIQNPHADHIILVENLALR